MGLDEGITESPPKSLSRGVTVAVHKFIAREALPPLHHMINERGII